MHHRDNNIIIILSTIFIQTLFASVSFLGSDMASHLVVFGVSLGYISTYSAGGKETLAKIDGGLV